MSTQHHTKPSKVNPGYIYGTQQVIDPGSDNWQCTHCLTTNPESRGSSLSEHARTWNRLDFCLSCYKARPNDKVRDAWKYRR